MAYILATKLHRPAPHAKWVRRPLLVQRLNEGLAAGRPLTLVCAPAGFGKTTCVCQWLDGLDLPISWLSLDPSDDDPGRFFTYFVAALQKVDAALGAEIASVLASGEVPSREAITAVLIDDVLRVGRPFVLVLDDFHVIQDGAILQVMESLLANHLPLLHLVLVTREDPLLPLARLRANDQLTEIRSNDLRFSAAETDRFLRDVMDLSLSPQDIAALENRTEGWVAGLQLAGLSMRGRDDPSGFIANLSGSHRYILSYLTEEVLNRQSAEVQGFLLETSILDRLSGDLCDAVTGRSDSRELLERLLSANLFLIALDDADNRAGANASLSGANASLSGANASSAGAGWYRYHHLFADLLRSQQSRIQKGRVAGLHLRASRWYEQAEMPNEAIDHALAGQDYPRAMQLLEHHAMSILTMGYAKTIEGWLQAIPEQLRAQSTRTNLAFAWMHLLRGNYPNIPPYLRQVETALAQTGAADPALRAEWLALQSNLANVQGRGEESVQLARQALEMIPPGDAYLLALSYLGLGGGYRITGDYPSLVDAYQRAIDYSRAAGVLLPEMISATALMVMAIQHGQQRFAFQVGVRTIERYEPASALPPPIAGTVYGMLGVIYFYWNQLAQAGEYFRRSAQMSRLVGHNAGIVYNAVLSSRLAQAEGDLDSADRLAREAARLLSQGVPAWIKPDAADQQVRVALAQDNPVAAQAALQLYGVSLEHINPPYEAYGLAHLRILVYQVRQAPRAADLLDQARAIADRLVEQTTRSHRAGMALQALLLRAQLNDLSGKNNLALDDLVRALALAAPEDNLRVFLDEGTSVTTLLRRYLERKEQNEEHEAVFARRLLDVLPPPASADTGLVEPAASKSQALPESAPPLEAPHREAQPLIEALTARELDVLRLIAEGLKYEQIAERLVISLNTVRFYVKEIYSKLGVNNRTLAIEEARKRGLF